MCARVSLPLFPTVVSRVMCHLRCSLDAFLSRMLLLICAVVRRLLSSELYDPHVSRVTRCTRIDRRDFSLDPVLLVGVFSSSLPSSSLLLPNSLPFSPHESYTRASTHHFLLGISCLSVRLVCLRVPTSSLDQIHLPTGASVVSSRLHRLLSSTTLRPLFLLRLRVTNPLLHSSHPHPTSIGAGLSTFDGQLSLPNGYRRPV